MRPPEDPAQKSNSRADHPDRSGESRRAEQAHRDWSTVAPSQRPLAIGRAKAADAFDAVLRDRWLRGDSSVSNVALADRYLGCDEKQPRQWRENERPMPLGAVFALPVDVAEDLLVRILADVRRARATTGARMALLRLTDAIADLKRTRIRDADVDDARRALRALAATATELANSLEEP